MPFLDWINKNQAIKVAKDVPYHLLKQEKSFGSESENLLIQGDNLVALKALLPFYAGQVKCIFIDPPYNTQSAFSHYDDKLEHSQWLSIMYPRLVLLRDLLAKDGSIWVSLDDNEAHYFKVLMDEVFGRSNFAANCIWEKVYSERMDAKGFSASHDHVLVYQRSNKFSPNQISKEQNSSQFGYWDEGAQRKYRRRSLRKEGSESLRKDRPSMWYSITAPDGALIWPIKPDGIEGRWRWKESNVIEKNKDLDFVHKDGKWEVYVKQYLADEPTRPPATLWLNEEVGHNHEAKLEVRAFNDVQVFDTPKPERLMMKVLDIATVENDIVLDSFLGSGTTAAVAHKMGRRYIGIEMGDHAETHCIPRLQKVIEGESGGISELVGWQGGGGFNFCTVSESIFNSDGSINSEVKFQTLASFIWHLETHQAGNKKFSSPLLGIHEGIAYYLLFNGILGDRRPESGNVLTGPVLKAIHEILPYDGPKVVYGETTRLGQSKLLSEQITFKQIPYDIKML
jgi:adenine-specific DNA-methyltransferase